ncbi:hypothetical protein E4T56_gene6076, partial [Termitomyces sp. T112]
MLRDAGHACPVVSVGSTPTAHFVCNLDGVTEVRAGVFMFFDLVMHGIGVCALDDIALSVVATVIGHRHEKGWILIDGGWMAMSRDRGTSRHPVDQGYGLVCDIDGTPWPDLIVDDASQEHGIIKVRPGSGATLPDLAIGQRVRILPNHACATGAQHGAYQVIEGNSHAIAAVWPRYCEMTMQLAETGLDPRECAYIDGQWQKQSGRERLPVVNPATGQVFAHVVAGDRTDLDRAVAAARAAFPAFAATPVAERLALLERIHALMTEQAEALAQTLSQEMGAAISHARAAHVPFALAHVQAAI